MQTFKLLKCLTVIKLSLKEVSSKGSSVKQKLILSSCEPTLLNLLPFALVLALVMGAEMIYGEMLFKFSIS